MRRVLLLGAVDLIGLQIALNNDATLELEEGVVSTTSDRLPSMTEIIRRSKVEEIDWRPVVEPRRLPYGKNARRRLRGGKHD